MKKVFFSIHILLFSFLFVDLIAQNNSISILDYGAIPNDNIDDSDAIQAAIEAAIANPNISKVYCPPGVYDLDKGVFISRKQTSTRFGFITLTISGHIASYSSNQSLGSTTVFKSKHKGFALAIQKGRNCVIENIVFQGPANYTANPSKILTQSDQEWTQSPYVSGNQYAPTCAIAIDPFHESIERNSRYENFYDSYSDDAIGGTSMLLIKGCSFTQFYIAIANNPSGGVRNGDNIRAEDCHVSLCHTFWSSGQSQSRTNSINNVYATFLHTFISGNQIGKQNGTPPFVSNVNIAGFLKQLVSLDTGFSGFWIQQSYMESVWSLGYANTNTIHFDQCQIKFCLDPTIKTYPSVHFYSNTSVFFDSCSLQFFDNCKTPAPIVIKAPQVIFNGGFIEGGVVTADGISNSGGELLHNVTFNGTLIKCLGKIAGAKTIAIPPSNLNRYILMGGDQIKDTNNNTYHNDNNTYNLEHFESAHLRQDLNRNYYIESNNPQRYQLGDNLFCTNPVYLADIGKNTAFTKARLGYVSKITNNKIFLSQVPSDISFGRIQVYNVSYPILNLPVYGTVARNSNEITLTNITSGFYPYVGMRLQSDFFHPGTFVERVDQSANKIYLNQPAKRTGQDVLISGILFPELR